MYPLSPGLMIHLLCLCVELIKYCHALFNLSRYIFMFYYINLYLINYHNEDILKNI